jgi:hypothetical protein
MFESFGEIGIVDNLVLEEDLFVLGGDGGDAVFTAESPQVGGEGLARVSP